MVVVGVVIVVVAALVHFIVVLVVQLFVIQMLSVVVVMVFAGVGVVQVVRFVVQIDIILIVVIVFVIVIVVVVLLVGHVVRVVVALGRLATGEVVVVGALVGLSAVSTATSRAAIGAEAAVGGLFALASVRVTATRVDLDDSPVVASLERGRVGMECLQVFQVFFRVLGRATAVLAHVQLGTSLLVLERELDLVHFVQVRLETAALRELAVAFGALERSHARVCSRVPFEIEGVVEALLTERAQVTFDVAMVLHVTVHETLELERFGADLALESVLGVIDYLDGCFLRGKSEKKND